MVRKYSILLVVVLVGIASILTLEESYIFHNILVLPIIGMAAYWVDRRKMIIPAVSALWLAVMMNVGELLDVNNIADFFRTLLIHFTVGGVLWFGVFFILIAIGFIIVFLLCFSSGLWKSKEKNNKIFAIFFCGISIVGGLFVVGGYNAFNGNPLSALYAEWQIHQYMEETYPQYDYTLDEMTYSFKSTGYSTNGTIYIEGEERAFYIKYGRGRIYEDYYDNYVEDRAKSITLAKQAEIEIETLLKYAGITYDSIGTRISVPTKKYENMVYDKEVVTEPIDIDIYKYTSKRESPEEFAVWCESIRQLLVAEGYTIDGLNMDSDPNFRVARLGLSISDEEITKPIHNIKSYKGYTDYAEVNGYSHLSEKEWEEAKELYNQDEKEPNKTLGLKVVKLLEILPLDILEVEAYESKRGLDMTVMWSGDPLTIEEFAKQCVDIREVIKENKENLGSDRLLGIHFNYISMPKQNDWYYDCYEGAMEEDEEEIVEMIKKDEKLMEKMNHN